MAQPLQPEAAFRPLLELPRLGLITDVDGTISALASQPEAAFVSPVAREALAALARRLPLVGALSGRALPHLRAMLDLPELLLIGSHGLAWWYQGAEELPEDALPYIDYARQARAQLAPLHDYPGIRFEEKQVGLALHYRHAADPDAARSAILAAVSGAPAAQRFELREGILVIELFPRLAVNKGTAIRRVVERWRLDGLIFFGDDLTDADAMLAATALRGGTNPAGVAGSAETNPRAEAGVQTVTPAIVLDAADYVVDGIAGTEAALRWLAAALAPRD
jgi:trehalose 6-phosphate phosphatase